MITKAKEWLKLKDPYFDLEEEVREFINFLGWNPDLFIDGAAKYGFGATMLSWMGFPVPNMDLSSSIQLGKITPAVGPLAQGQQGTKEWKDVLIETMSQLMGPVGMTGINMLKGVFDDSMSGVATLKVLSPAIIRNMLDAGTALFAGEHRNSRGEKLVDVDIHDPKQFFEVMATLLGAPPTRVRQAQEYWASIAQEKTYYTSRKEKLLANYSEASSEVDNREEIAEARQKIITFNKTAPPWAHISTEAMIESRRNRGRRESLRERGLPTEKRFIQLHRGRGRHIRMFRMLRFPRVSLSAVGYRHFYLRLLPRFFLPA